MPRLAAEAGTAIFEAAYERWLDEPGHDDVAALVRYSLGELRAVACIA